LSLKELKNSVKKGNGKKRGVISYLATDEETQLVTKNEMREGGIDNLHTGKRDETLV